MQFRTSIAIPRADFSITHTDGIVLLGSCFTENIGQLLKQQQFKVNINPFGIIYNPISLFKNLQYIISKKTYTEEDLLLHNELYLSLDHHGSFSGVDKHSVLANINAAIEQAYHDFYNSRYVVFTLGSSIVYKHKEQGRVVANCHKLASQMFLKYTITIDAIKQAFLPLREHLTDKKVIFTVSPVRHWRDGATENMRSKSILIESIHQLIQENDCCQYFPAYELLMDELRDYRFYEADMLHPNTTAVNYIWERFEETYFDTHTSQINNRIQKIRQLLNHRIKHPETREQQKFQANIERSIADFKNDYPTLETDF